ncbi:NAD-dependent epimerase/dehydratase family protein [Mucilaginibacter panaciglaebae]|uniref:Oxidoreductase n=1 Tax=Mucilaginibacter panaciglaebae TaxID=502331 RepID=A0ABP7X391_9SPHI
MTKKAVIVGASGLIGSKLLDVLLAQPDYTEVLSISRKKIKLSNKKLKKIVADFDHLNNYEDEITGDVIFCCLGTTRRDTPDLDDYRKVDHDYPVRLAQIALKKGIDQYHYVSAMGARSESSNFYTKIKGDTENDLKKVGLKGLFIYQPSILIGHRNKPRVLESIAVFVMKIIGPLLVGKLKKYRAINALDVAKAMYKQSLTNQSDIITYTSDEIKKRA